jgi:hypothetical protein
MIHLLVGHDYRFDNGATNVNLLAVAGVGLADNLDRLGLSTYIPVKFYQLPQQLFQTETLALASDCRRPRRRTLKPESAR